MADLEDIAKKIVLIGALLGAVVVALKNLAALYEVLKPYLASAVLLGTVVVPNATLVWYCLYVATINSSRMVEVNVFLTLAAQLTAAASVYTFCWGKWVYPRLSPWVKRKFEERRSSHARTLDEQKKGGAEPPESSG